jgi:hypothetical protein
MVANGDRVRRRRALGWAFLLLLLLQYTMERGVVHACHAGGVVHCLEGWEHHEVGALEVDRIDVVWEAALKHGLTPA